MGAYNGRLLPRSIFGLPLEGVVLSGIAFCLLVLLLLPGEKLHAFRPLFLFGCVSLFIKARNIINSGHLAIIFTPLKAEENLRKASVSLAGEALAAKPNKRRTL